ncbi:hypothetical protein EG329_006993 [Mollisiaceae sp. DMI_Dod_QoI]|nr:hypothetical protein EG329_006993 [Helotiales sp. DMI_Dod_QoI]
MQRIDAQALIQMYDRCSCILWRRCDLQDTWQRIRRHEMFGLAASRSAPCCFRRTLDWPAPSLDPGYVFASSSSSSSSTPSDSPGHDFMSSMHEALSFDTTHIMLLQNRRAYAAAHAGVRAAVGLGPASALLFDERQTPAMPFPWPSQTGHPMSGQTWLGRMVAMGLHTLGYGYMNVWSSDWSNLSIFIAASTSLTSSHCTWPSNMRPSLPSAVQFH